MVIASAFRVTLSFSYRLCLSNIDFVGRAVSAELPRMGRESLYLLFEQWRVLYTDKQGHSGQPLYVVAGTVTVVADFLSVSPHTCAATTTMEAIVDAGGTVGNDLNAIPKLLACFPHDASDAARGKRRGVDIDVQRVFVWWAAGVFNDAQVVWVDSVPSKAISNLKL